MRPCPPGLLVLALVGCGAQHHAPLDLSRIYANDAPLAADTLPTTLFVPGVLGSQILDPATGRIYWGEIGSGTPQCAKDPDDARALALDIDDGASFAGRTDALTHGAVLHVVTVKTPLGGVDLRVYPGVLEGLAAWLVVGEEGAPVQVMEVGTDADETGGLGAAPYDWRLDLVAAARQLDARVREASAERLARTGEARVDLVAHSLGTLVTRWFLMYGTADLGPDGALPALTWEGAAHVRSAVLVAPPSAGSPMVFESLVDGQKVSAFMPRFPGPLVGTFPALYELMPRVRHAAVVYTDDLSAVDLYDPEVWIRYRWGMLDPEQDDMLAAVLPGEATRGAREIAAVAWLRRVLPRARQVQAALDVAGEPPAHLQVHLFAGDTIPTPSRLGIDRATGARTWLDTEAGDGSVTRRSALLDERGPDSGAQRVHSPIPWTTATWGASDHLGMVEDGSFLDGLLWLLLQAPE